MSETKKKQLLAWCENCGDTIYTGDKHTEDVSELGNRYFHCSKCTAAVHTPDEELESEEI